MPESGFKGNFREINWWQVTKNDIERLNHAKLIRSWLKVWLVNILMAGFGIVLIVAVGRLILWLLSGMGPVMYITH